MCESTPNILSTPSSISSTPTDKVECQRNRLQPTKILSAKFVAKKFSSPLSPLLSPPLTFAAVNV